MLIGPEQRTRKSIKWSIIYNDNQWVYLQIKSQTLHFILPLSPIFCKITLRPMLTLSILISCIQGNRNIFEECVRTINQLLRYMHEKVAEWTAALILIMLVDKNGIWAWSLQTQTLSTETVYVLRIADQDMVPLSVGNGTSDAHCWPQQSMEVLIAGSYLPPLA